MTTILVACAVTATLAFVALAAQAICTLRQVRHTARAVEYLALNANRIVSRTDIWQHVYDFNASLESNVVDVFIGLLRKKIERPGHPRLLHTRRGQGYMLAETGEPA